MCFILAFHSVCCVKWVLFINHCIHCALSCMSTVYSVYCLHWDQYIILYMIMPDLQYMLSYFCRTSCSLWYCAVHVYIMSAVCFECCVRRMFCQHMMSSGHLNKKHTKSTSSEIVNCL